MKKCVCFFTITLLAASKLSAQSSADTTALFKEFTKVMSFTSQPYLFYTTTTRMSAQPVLAVTDTATMQGEFYKNSTEIYSSTGREELYLQDSLMVEVNNERKTIWVRKVDIGTKNNLNVVPVNTKDMLARFKKNYKISKVKVSDEVSRIYFEQNKSPYSSTATNTVVSIEYSEKTMLPQLIEISVELKQPVNDEILEMLRTEGYDEAKLVKIIDGQKQLERMQKVSIVFNEIKNDKEKLEQMPLYKSGLRVDASTSDISGKGRYENYEITKTF